MKGSSVDEARAWLTHWQAVPSPRRPRLMRCRGLASTGSPTTVTSTAVSTPPNVLFGVSGSSGRVATDRVLLRRVVLRGCAAC